MVLLAASSAALAVPGQQRHARGGQAPAQSLQALRPCRSRPATTRTSSYRQHVACSLRREKEDAVSSSGEQQTQQLERQASSAAAPPPPAVPVEVEVMEELSQPLQQAAAPTRWMPASLLSGWKGAGTLMLSLGAVTGGGLLGSGFDVSGPGSVLLALGVLGFTVGIHEAGHFFAAVTRGIHVTKFSIGFGPTLLKWQGKEVEYSLRLLPLGGYVAFPDDDPESPYPIDDPDLLRNRSLGDRAAVISAGVLANIALAFTICLIQAGTVGVTEPVYGPGVKLGEIRPGTVAERAGLRRGDIVLTIGDLVVAPAPGSVNAVVEKIKVNPKRELMLTIERNGELLSLPVTPAEVPDGTGRLGISLASNSEMLRKTADGPVQAVKLAAEEFVTLTTVVLKGLYQLFSNFSNTVENVSGPIAIVNVGAEVARSKSGGGLFQFAALVNINLAVVNILPLPALDGGYLVFIALEALRGKKLNEGLEKGIMGAGFLLLMTAGVSLIVKDALDLTGIGSMFQ